uniref:Uncharacterized protein n=1 Tax=Accipiter nisus TaxID=211598 RepID=A0A8B9NJ20_9AVES
MMFRDQVGIVAGWFKGWNECEQTVALLSLLKRVTRTQARFLQLCLEHSLADCTDIHLLEAEANSAGEWRGFSGTPGGSLPHLVAPPLAPGTSVESRQLLSYALIHPATTLDDRSALALWLGHLEERLAGGSSPPARPPYPDTPRRPPPSHEWPEHVAPELGLAWPEAAPRENGHPPFHPPASGNALPCQLHPSPLKRSLSLVPSSPQGGGNEWSGGGDEPAVPIPPRPPFGDHAPLSPQSSVASSGSEQTEELAGSGGQGTHGWRWLGGGDVPSWLKSLRLHKSPCLCSACPPHSPPHPNQHVPGSHRTSWRGATCGRRCRSSSRLW